MNATAEAVETVEAPQPTQPRGQGGRWENDDPLLPMSLSRLAAESDMPKATLHRLLSGRKRARLDEAVKIAENIGMPLEKLAAELLHRYATSTQPKYS